MHIQPWEEAIEAMTLHRTLPHLLLMLALVAAKPHQQSSNGVGFAPGPLELEEGEDPPPLTMLQRTGTCPVATDVYMHEPERDCESECTIDADCSGDEKCCVVGCKHACAKAHVKPLYTPVGVGFVLMLLCGWAIACGTTGPSRKAV